MSPTLVDKPKWFQNDECFNEGVNRDVQKGVRDLVVIHPIDELEISKELYVTLPTNNVYVRYSLRNIR